MSVAELFDGERHGRDLWQPARVIVLKPAGEKETLASADAQRRLIEAVATAHDRGAFAALFSYFAPRVKAFLMRSGLDETAAEEVTQETMLAMWRKASYFDPSRAGVSTWIFTIARNQRIDRLRRGRAQTTQGVVDPDDEPPIQVSGEDIAIAADRERQVRTALGTLSHEQSTIVRLSYFAEKPHAEIARELGIPLGTVKSRIRLALSRLRTLLDNDL